MQQLSLVVAIVVVAWSSLAALVAVLAALQARSERASCLTYASELAQQLRKTRQLETQVAELDDAWQKSLDQIKRLRSRYGMRDLRERQNVEDDSGANLQGPAWKEKMRRSLKLLPGAKQRTLFGGSGDTSEA